MYQETEQYDKTIKTFLLIAESSVSRPQLAPDIPHLLNEPLLNATGNKHLPPSKIHLFRILKPILLLIIPLNGNIQLGSKLLITNIDVLGNNVLQGVGLFGTHQKLTAGTNLGELVLEQGKGLLGDGQFQAVSDEDQLGLQAAD